MTTQEVAEDAGHFDDIAAAAVLDIQLAFDRAMAGLAAISQGWEKSSRETLKPLPAECNASSDPAASQAA